MSTSWFQSLFASSNGEENNQFHQTRDCNQNATKESLDSVLAKSVLKMSLDSREKALEEINGIPQRHIEDPIQIENGLRDLESFIQLKKRGTVYEFAELMDRSYVSSKDFRLMFLRSTRYDPKAATDRLFKFLDTKRDLFGPAKLVKKITLQDLDQDDIEYLKTGACQILPHEDSAGRKICLIISSLRNFKTFESELRARFYLYMLLCESEESQLKGITFVFHGLVGDGQKTLSRGKLWVLPIHFASIHVCFNHYRDFLQNSFLVYFLPDYFCQRVRVHYVSSFDKCQDILSDFGIPIHLLPTSAETFPTKEYHSSWLEQRRKMELGGSHSSASEGFTDKDVLFGHHRCHIGNIRCRQLILEWSEAYDLANKKDKAEIAETIVQEIKNSGGRFLKKQNNNIGWEEVSEQEAKKKIAHTFRNNRRGLKAVS